MHERYFLRTVSEEAQGVKPEYEHTLVPYRNPTGDYEDYGDDDYGDEEYYRNSDPYKDCF